MIDARRPEEGSTRAGDCIRETLARWGFENYACEQDNAPGKLVHSGRHPDGFVARMIEWRGYRALYLIEVQAPDFDRRWEDAVASGLKRTFRRLFGFKGIMGCYYRGVFRVSDDLTKPSPKPAPKP